MDLQIHIGSSCLAPHPNFKGNMFGAELAQREWLTQSMACRTMLLKLERLSYDRLPAAQAVGVGNSVKVVSVP